MSLVRKPAGMELIDLLDRVLDKGIVVEASSRLYLLRSDSIRHGKHLVIASIETHLKHSEARAVSKVAGRLAVASQKTKSAPEPIQLVAGNGRRR
jgi:Gas vesicle protein